MRISIINRYPNRWLKPMASVLASKGHQVVVFSDLYYKHCQESDVVICCWADEYAQTLGSNQKLCDKYILFCRSYELFYGHSNKVNPENFDHTVFVNDHLRREFCPDAKLIYNGIDFDEFPLQDHEDGNTIGILANINHKKGIELMMQVIKKYRNMKFHIAGKVQERRYKTYFEYMKPDNLTFDGHQKDIKEWMKDKNYILLTSAVEGNPNCIIEAMAMGVKPIIHNFPGSHDQFPPELIFTKLEAIDHILKQPYDPVYYRNFVKQRYDANKVYLELEELCRT